MLSDVEIRSVSPVFVGRVEEIGVLNEAFARVTSGERDSGGTAAGPQTLLVGGEAGVGKTRFLEEFAGRACQQGAIVAIGGCVEIGADGLPFAPFSAALRALRRQLPDEVAAAAAGREEDLSRLLPELGEFSRDRHDEESMARLFELTARVLERIAADRTVVVALEDMHWADASTRHLLAYLFRTLRSGRLVVIATYRTDDVHRRHPLRPLLAELDRLRTVTRVELARFNREEVRGQMTGILAAEPDPTLVDEVFERSDGNAFFVEELAVAENEGCATGLTDSLRDLLLVRVEALPGHAEAVVRLVAEGGSTVEYALLAAVSRLGEDELIEALRVAVGANILLASPDGDGFRFRHSLVREAVSDDLLPGERTQLNRRYAQALEAGPGLVGGDVRTTRLASYWYHAHDAEKALPVVLRASVEARRRHAYAEQLRLLERAMELWDEAPHSAGAELRPADHAETYPACAGDGATTPLSYIDLMAEAAVAGRLCGERERALKICKRALNRVDERADPLRAAWFWVQRSRLIQSLGRGDGWHELGTAQTLVKGLPPSEVHAEVLANVASWSMLHDPGPDSLLAAQRAVDYARMLNADDIEMNARITLGGLMVDAGDIEAGLAEMYEVRDQAVAREMAAHLGRSHVNLPSALEGIGRSAEAVRVLKEGVGLAREYGLMDTEAYVFCNMAESLLSLGLWDEAEAAVESAARTALSAKTRGSAGAHRAQLLLWRGQMDRAQAELDAARAHFGTHDPMPQHSMPLAGIAAGIAAGQGRLLDARAVLATALDAGFPPGTQRYGWPLVLAAASLEAESRGLPAAEPGRAESVHRIRGSAKTLAAQAPIWKAHEQWVRAELLRAEDRDTVADWAAVHAAFEPLEAVHDLARVRHRLAEALLSGDRQVRAGRGTAGESAGLASAVREGAARRSLGDRERALVLIRQVTETAERLGAVRLAEAAAQLAQRARLPLAPAAERDTTPRPLPSADEDPAETLGLTARERDVLRLVAVGRSNRQIAEELFISPKTASVHVSNILAKLGVSGRGEAAAIAHRLRLFPTAPEPMSG
ncbi:AAA family ATPase [Streptomyces tsukubensis]|uniref:HTH luxR-type domain-containing protein n=2 Tax=Streptomyces tsukubensis TaxID=83656 RepID=A0A1V4AA75_9ACTN|nr:hypothetical protein B1H18_14105 [Streptomyces tsukubensis]QFR98030.1 AAA family ATPase [Streptomyces tsukubensis]